MVRTKSLGEEKLCALVVGCRPDGWLVLLRDEKRFITSSRLHVSRRHLDYFPDGRRRRHTTALSF
ncbi:hypothetical protein K505DRAFT_90422 [Melanomma pulvis-pyrius CBS 109.77]|uniref:Uncharacterized protein n=1 Tax=Melanomma pulvis-pyrius CBS 109.77 TaxID=1314802 RepID=A0A6A6X0K4_9PLEO|nr:hypothetical protein K505DRAFT_90422 [Melanomma pulvis-pyrius CBS 109.77]